MCIGAPKVKVPQAPERQAMQVPKDITQNRDNARYKRLRRGFYASIFTGPSGLAGPPTVTGTTGGVTGG